MATFSWLTTGNWIPSITADATGEALYAGVYSRTVNGKLQTLRFDVLLGGAGNDSLYGDDLGVYISGGGGDDTIFGGAMNDTIEDNDGSTVNISALGGDDTIITTTGMSGSIDGGTGTDRLQIYGDISKIKLENVESICTYRSDFITITAEQLNAVQSIQSRRYDDLQLTLRLILKTAGIIDISSKGLGAPTEIYGSSGGDIVTLGSSRDWFIGGAGDDIVYGGAGNDIISLEEGNDVAYGGDGNDFIDDLRGMSTEIYGDGGDDKIEVYSNIYSGNNAFYSISGKVDGGDGFDIIFGTPDITGIDIFNVEALYVTGPNEQTTGFADQFENFQIIANSTNQTSLPVRLKLGKSGSVDISSQLKSYSCEFKESDEDDNIVLGSGNDKFICSDSLDVNTFDGGMGRDIASYDNTSDNYTVTRNADGSVTVADISGGASSGRDTLRNIEIVKFIDTGLRLHGGIHDFDDSGSADILLRNSEGVTGLWSMNGITVTSLTLTSVQVLNDWEIKAIADFDGNGTSDILWLHADSGSALDGVSYVSYQDGAAATGGNVVQQLSGWSIAGVGDFTGDGKADVLYRSDTTGMTYLDVMDGAAIDWSSSGFTSSQVTDTKWTVAAVADFNGDGKADLLWRYDNATDLSDPLNGTLFEWKMDGSNVTSADLLSQQASGNWQVAGTGDFDGNGTADILFRYHNASNTSDALNGLSYIDFMNGEMVAKGAPTRWQVGEDWQLASIGDFDGNLKSDILWRQTSTGATYAWLMDGTNVAAAGFTSEQAGTGWATQNGTLIG